MRERTHFCVCACVPLVITRKETKGTKTTAYRGFFFVCARPNCNCFKSAEQEHGQTAVCRARPLCARLCQAPNATALPSSLLPPLPPSQRTYSPFNSLLYPFGGPFRSGISCKRAMTPRRLPSTTPRVGRRRQLVGQPEGTTGR